MTLVAQHLPAILNSVDPIVKRYGYFAVFGLLLLEDFGLFFIPGESTLIVAALLAGLGNLNIILVMLVAVLGAVIGDNIGYAIGSLGGRALIERYGKYVFLNDKKTDRLTAFFNRNGGKVVLVARFIDVLRQANGIIAGISDMTWMTFLKFNLLGAILWVGFWSTIGYYGGSHIDQLLKYQLYLSIGAIGFLCAYIIYKLIKRKSER